MSSIREIIIRLNDRFTNWVIYSPLRREKDPQRRFEIKLWMEISGVLLGGQAADGAWTKYKQFYYDKISSEEEKKKVKDALLTMLKSDNYKISQKAIIAHVCADLGIKEALQDINELLLQVRSPSDNATLSLASEALSKDTTVKELIYEKFQKGERM